MKLLVTGATGYIGARAVSAAQARGHHVTGAVRSAARGASLPSGVAPLVADLADHAALVAAARAHDAVLHLGFASHGGDWFAAVAQEAQLIAAWAAALAGSTTKLIVANGTAFYGDAGGRFLTEDAAIPDTPFAVRAAATRPATTTPGLHGIELRLASFVHGYGGSVFLPPLVAHARKTGRSLLVGAGRNRLSTVHVDAAAEAFVLAAEVGPAGAVFHIAADEAPTMGQLAEAIALATGARVTAVTEDEAAAALDPFTAAFLTLDNGLSSRAARWHLGWSGSGHPGLLWDVAHGSYATAPAPS